MLGQVFEFKDLSTVGVLLVLEALLSADNALILALIVRHLPRDQQRKALLYGLAGAFALRLAAIVLASSIISFWWLQLIGALYLLYLPIKHFIKQASQVELRGYAGAGFWMTVVYADLADLAFAIDSVLVAVAIEPHQNKIWVVYLGAVLGIILLRWAAGACLSLLERYPVFDHLAYVLVGWAGVKLLLLSGHTFERWYESRFPGAQLPITVPEMHPAVFWSGMALIAGVGSWLALRKPAAPPGGGKRESSNPARAAEEAAKPAPHGSE